MVTLGLLSLLLACSPTCKKTCKKLLDCEEVETPRVAQDECEVSCSTQESLFRNWDDTQLQDAFDEQKKCIAQNECDAIADGVCYDEDLYIW